jgi:gluconolactonase
MQLKKISVKQLITPLLGLALCGCSMFQTTANKTTAIPTIAKGEKLKVVYQSPGFYEGPAWDKKSQKLLFTAFGQANGKKFQRIMRLDDDGKATVWLDNTGGVNGMFMANNGTLLGAVYIKHQLTAMTIGKDKPAAIKILATNKQWMQPNDVCQTANGNIYFTDPDFSKKSRSRVFKLSPQGKVTTVITDMTLPNGVIASPDGKILYVADSQEKLWKSYPIKADGTVGAGKIFFNPKVKNKRDPDGMTVDVNGNLYLTGRGGIWIISPAGKQLGMIPIKEFCSNCTFGGKAGKTLFITARNKLYAVKMTISGT